MSPRLVAEERAVGGVMTCSVACCERVHGADVSAEAFAGEGAVVHSSADGGGG